MTLQEIEKRLVRLERDPAHSRLARMTDEQIEAEALSCLEVLMAPGVSFAVVVAEMEASDEPEIREGAKAMVQHFGPRFGYAPTA